MESIKSTLFEDPFFIYLMLAVAQVVIIVMWRTSGRSGRWLAGRLLIVTALAGAAFAVERLVVTDREQIGLAMRDIAESVPAGRIDRAVVYLDDNYRGWGAGRPGPRVKPLVALAAKAAVAQFKVQSIKLVGTPRIEVDGQLATCDVTMLITYSPEGTPLKYPMRWKLTWIQRPEGWRIERAEQWQG